MRVWYLVAILIALVAIGCGESTPEENAAVETTPESEDSSSAEDGAEEVPGPTPSTTLTTTTSTTLPTPSTTAGIEPTPTTIAAESGTRRQQAVMRDLLNQSEIVGSNVEIIATAAGLEVLVSSVDLSPGHPITAWLVFFNDEAECSKVVGGGCEPMTLHLLGMPEFGNIGFLGGALADESGTVTITGKVSTGMIPSPWWDTEFLTPLTAVYHVVLQDHGPPIDGMVEEMLATHRAGCTDDSISPWLPPPAFDDGTPGPNTCVEVQGVRFAP